MENSSNDASKAEENHSDEEDKSSSPTEKGGPPSNKITILFHAVSNTPITKKKKWLVEPERTIGGLVKFLRKLVKMTPSDSLFLYVNQSFAPSPDQTVGSLYKCFGVEGVLNIHYCRTQAWG